MLSPSTVDTRTNRRKTDAFDESWLINTELPLVALLSAFLRKSNIPSLAACTVSSLEFPFSSGPRVSPEFTICCIEEHSSIH